MLVIVGPSGAGKSTIQDLLKEKYCVRKVISYTTRAPRFIKSLDRYEEDGENYTFVTEEKFNQLKDEGFFIETVVYRENQYGTPADQWGLNTSLIVEPSGLKMLKERPEPFFSVFISASKEQREKRLLERGDDKEEVLKRLDSDDEVFMNAAKEVDCIFINEANILNYSELVRQVGVLLEKYIEWRDYNILGGTLK